MVPVTTNQLQIPIDCLIKSQLLAKTKPRETLPQQVSPQSPLKERLQWRCEPARIGETFRFEKNHHSFLIGKTRVNTHPWIYPLVICYSLRTWTWPSRKFVDLSINSIVDLSSSQTVSLREGRWICYVWRKPMEIGTTRILDMMNLQM